MDIAQTTLNKVARDDKLPKDCKEGYMSSLILIAKKAVI